MKYITERELNRILAKRDVELINQFKADLEIILEQCRSVAYRREGNQVLRPPPPPPTADNVIDIKQHRTKK